MYSSSKSVELRVVSYSIPSTRSTKTLLSYSIESALTLGVNVLMSIGYSEWQTKSDISYTFGKLIICRYISPTGTCAKFGVRLDFYILETRSFISHIG